VKTWEYLTIKPPQPNSLKNSDDCGGSKLGGVGNGRAQAVRFTDRGSTAAQGDQRLDRRCASNSILKFFKMGQVGPHNRVTGQPVL
jgi:hypothetical protein